ncbi:MAG: DUF1501 domain-containing protein [Acidobacteria bacterium]|nr:DUF1501 domain-containing protein [Acidobacteriota bacterium]
MTKTRREFLKETGCAALGTGLLAAGIQEFGLVRAFAQGAASDYKALVCLFMSGGNDGNNTVVPIDDARYNQYSGARQGAGLAIARPGMPTGPFLLPVSPASGGQYGLHPSMADLQTLFAQNRLAIVPNVGPLVEPLTKATYQSGAGKRPVQLFSHSDQVNQWLTSVSHETSQTGWGGRTADRAAALNGASTFPQMISIAGVNLFVTGQTTRPLAIGDSNTPLANVLPINNPVSANGVVYTTAQNDARRAAYDQLRTFVGAETLTKAAADITTSARQTGLALAAANPTIATVFPNTSLGRQLLQVARVIKSCGDPAAAAALNMKRQIFFVAIGGFDTHSNQMQANSHASLLTQVSQAMKAFYDATVELGLADKITTFTLSDFGRTLQPAGAGAGVGSDHAWGNHHLVMGGAVRGGDIYGQFPELALGGPDDTDGGANPRGRWIPDISVEQYAATLAQWYGLAQSDLPLVFPLIGRFATSNLGFMS